MIKPLPGYVLIEAIEDEQKSSGGVYLPESSKDKPSRGKVVACGDGEHIITKEIDGIKMAPVMEGQTVIYKKWTNQEVQDEGKTYLLVKFDELLAIIE